MRRPTTALVEPLQRKPVDNVTEVQFTCNFSFDWKHRKAGKLALAYRAPEIGDNRFLAWKTIAHQWRQRRRLSVKSAMLCEGLGNVSATKGNWANPEVFEELESHWSFVSAWQCKQPANLHSFELWSLLCRLRGEILRPFDFIRDFSLLVLKCTNLNYRKHEKNDRLNCRPCQPVATAPPRAATG